MRLSVVLGFAACFLLPFQGQAAWDIFQSYVILDSGSGDQYLAGGLNADGATAFAGTDLGDFTAADALTLNGGELKTYKNSGSNVCGGTLNYRVYASGDTPGTFTALALPYDSELANPGDQKWAATGAGIDLLGALTAGDYVLELYWEATGDDTGGCSDTKYDSDFGNNFTATFSIVVPGCTDPAYAEYDALANTDDGSCSTLIDPCENALVLGSIEVELSTTTLTAEDGSATLTVTAGTPTSLTLSGINGAADYTIAQPGAIDGIAAGSYSVMATDANGCTSNTLMLIMPYSLCCDCGVNDQDSDGLCDDEDNCFDRNATNFADPANEACIIPGCMDPAYTQYYPGANVDDGSCSTLVVEGCTDPVAPNYDPAANTDDGSCIYYGCIDAAADNYDASANTDDGSCIYYGCTDTAADNYDAAANTNDGSCIYYGCTYPDADNYDASANTEDGSCLFPGCMDPAYSQYDPTANADDGSCTTLVVYGCTDPDYWEYDAAANTDDGSCQCLIVDPTCVSPTMDGYSYDVVQMGCQCWFAENLRTTTYTDGTVIPAGLTDGEWTTTTSGATTVYGEGSSSCGSNSPDIDACDEAQSLATYGRLYNGYAVADARGLCPAGWHLPSDAEWIFLENYLGIDQFDVYNPGERGWNQGRRLKSTSGWAGNGDGTDDYGFSALPGGTRMSHNGGFNFDGSIGYYWGEFDGYRSWIRQFRDIWSGSGRVHTSGSQLRVGYSVRCIKETTVTGCTDPAYLEYDAEANLDDGSCATLVDPDCVPPNLDGYDYDVVQIGDQCWFAENLRTTTYSDGTVIPAGLTEGEWSATTTGATAVYGEGDSYCNEYTPGIDACDDAQSLVEYGRLYNWYAVDDTRGLCPSGWHVPTDEDWMALEMQLGLSEYQANSTGNRGWNQGSRLKSTSGWASNGNGTDHFGFSALPGSRRWSNGKFYNAGSNGEWWSSSPFDANRAWNRLLARSLSTVSRNKMLLGDGMSVRCLRNIEGCTDPAFTEYSALAYTDDGSCSTPVVEGCTDSAAGNYDASANTDDGSCIYYGCIDAAAGNYDASANTDDGSCIYYGCTDSAYVEYDASANTDDGSCATLVVEGCTDPTADNYNAAANTDDGSCIVPGCMDAGYTEYNAAATYDDGSCATVVVNGCTAPTADNYNAAANTDDGSCLIPGCMDAGYVEYNAAATYDDGSCATVVVNGCTDPDYLEFDAAANTDDGSCQCLIVDPACVSPSMDGYSYDVVQIGCQCWFAENLRTTTYADGTAIVTGLTDDEWAVSEVGATAVFGEDGSPCSSNSPDIDACDEAQSLAAYGRLYNWWAVDDPRGLCPAGWHVPTFEETQDLANYVTDQGYGAQTGKPLKTTSGWKNNGNGTDDFGFSVVPGGVRSYVDGRFSSSGSYGYIWTSSVASIGTGTWYEQAMHSYQARSRRFSYNRTYMEMKHGAKISGFSVRCLKD